MKSITSVLDINEIRYILSMDLVLIPFRANVMRRQMMWIGLGWSIRKAVAYDQMYFRKLGLSNTR